jgi:hypothetical protein
MKELYTKPQTYFTNSFFQEHTKLMVQNFHIIQNLSLQENKDLDIQN